MSEQARALQGRPARRREIVDTARAIAAEQGWAAVTVRAVAGRIGCSPPAIYQYFRDKDAVLSALAAEGNMQLDLALDQAITDVHGPAKRLRAMLRTLWDYSLDNREICAVMFGFEGQTAHPGTATDALAPVAMAHAASDLLAKRGSGDNGQDLADRLVAVTYGFIGLTAGGNFPGGRDRAFALFTETVDTLLKDVGR